MVMTLKWTFVWAPLVVLLVLTHLCFASNTSVIAGSGQQFGQVILQTKDGGFLAAVDSKHSTTVIVKFDANQGVEWSTSLPFRRTLSIVETKSGYILQSYHSLAKVDQNGNLIWHSILTANFLSPVIQVKRNLVVATTYEASGRFSVFKVDGNGHSLWLKNYHTAGCTESENGSEIVRASGGGFIVSGWTNCSPAGPFLLKLDGSGNAAWRKVYHTDSVLFSGNVLVTGARDGGYALVASLRNLSSTTYLQVFKVDAKGNLQWQKSYASGLSIRKITQDRDDGYLLLAGGGGTVKLDSAGNFVWKKSHDFQGSGSLEDISQTTDGGHIAIGRAHTPFGARYDAWLTLLDGNLDSTRSSCVTTAVTSTIQPLSESVTVQSSGSITVRSETTGELHGGLVAGSFSGTIIGCD